MDDITSLLRKYTGHQHVVLLPRGNRAILAALQARTGSDNSHILIPDQGGWITYEQYPQKLGKKSVKVKTEGARVVVEDLKKKINEACCFLYQNPGGYYAEQPIQEIFGVCSGKIPVILDVSGSLGDPALCDGRYADIIVGSFRHWKIVDAGYGGFVSSHTSRFLEGIEQEFDGRNAERVLEKLRRAPERVQELYARCTAIKRDLSAYDVVHPTSKSVVVVVRFNNEKEFSELRNYCEEKDLEFTRCPRYIRIMEDAISIEVKR